ncbi:MAG: hypothetical protein ACJZ1O_02460 [Candidatus Neomarinimicrobiota bacterium]|nr:MAG: hypothetical protein EVA23_04495 [bacterium]
MNKRTNISFFIIGIIFLLVFYSFYPFGLPNAKRYFDPIGQRTLQKDEIGQFNYVYNTYELMDITGDEFIGWDTSEHLRWRYGIAFSSYAMPSIAMISQKHADRAKHAMYLMINKMKSPKVWGDWISYGMGDDPISEGNVMYKGHLNLMYGLYQLMTGNEEFSREFTWLTSKIINEMRRHHLEGKHEGADCEPGRYFAQCNSISLLSLKIYDKLYGTDYSDVEASWTINFIKQKMTDQNNGFYLKMYNTKHQFCNPQLSGYTNAWTMTFLRVYEQKYNDDLYPVWKENFTQELGPFAYVKEDLEAGASPLAHLTGLLAAKEFEDISLFRKLRNSIDRKLYQKDDLNHYLYSNINNPIYNGPILWTKVHVGWKKVLEHNWGYTKNFIIPDIDNMQWTDVLDTKLFIMDL